MFLLFRFGLIPVVLFCLTILAATVDTLVTNLDQQATWRRTVATVTDARDPGDLAAQVRGTPNTFPDPHGGLVYVAEGTELRWRGRGREIGVTEMKPGAHIEIFYDPQDPHRIGTLVLLGRTTGFTLAAAASAFLAAYVWFFWLRRRSA
jgi:hypothetical protein